MKTYVLVGTGYRGLWSYCEPLVREYADVAKLAAVCDINPKRAKLVGDYLKADIPAYTDFDRKCYSHRSFQIDPDLPDLLFAVSRSRRESLLLWPC